MKQTVVLDAVGVPPSLKARVEIISTLERNLHRLGNFDRAYLAQYLRQYLAALKSKRDQP